VIDADGVAGAVGRLARQRAEDGFGSGREEFAKLAEAAETGPDGGTVSCGPSFVLTRAYSPTFSISVAGFMP